MQRLILTAIAAIAILSLSACNTMQGLGKDVKKAGEKLEEAAKK
jgi:predicted small secreted protein